MVANAVRDAIGCTVNGRRFRRKNTEGAAWADVRIEAGEDRTTEFKPEIGNDLSAVGKAVCAFANEE